jgi:CPA2 family monovalent cation:H+ antiporter-2
VVVGYGVSGQIVTAALLSTGTPVVVLDVSVEAVRAARARNIPIYYADASSAEALHHAHLADAAGLVILINDPVAVGRIVETARSVAPNVPIVLRAHYLREREALLTAGATDVVADELEAGLEVLARLLRMQSVPRNIIDDEIAAVRAATQPSARRTTLPRKSAGETTELDDLRFDAIRLLPNAWAVGKNLSEIHLGSRSGALAAAIRRDSALLDRVDPLSPLRADDIIYLVGDGRAIRSACSLLTRGNPNPPSPTTAIHLAVK